MLYRHVINMNEENWTVKKRAVEEYVLTRRGTNTYYCYDVRIERNSRGELVRVYISLSTGTIELPLIVFQILGLLVKEGILRQDEVLRE